MFNRKSVAKLAAAGLAAAMVLTGCTPAASSTLVNINKGEAKIEYGYGYFMAKYYQSLYDMTYGSYYGSGFWTQDLANDGSTMEADVKDSVMDEMKSEYILNQHTSDYNISLTDDETKAIDDAADKFFSDNDEDALKAMGATKDYVKKMLTDNTVTAKMKSAIEAETEVSLTDDETGQSKISYVKFSTAATTDSDGNKTEMSDEDKAAAKAKADELASVMAADFEDKAKELDASVQTYTYTTAADSYENESLPEAVIKAAKEVEEGHTSGVIEDADTGYYVVRMDAVHDDEATATKTKELTQSAQEDHYKEVLDGWESDLKWSVDDKLWKKVTMTDSTFTMKQSTTDTSTDTTSDGAVSTDSGADTTSDGAVSTDSTSGN